ncbi:MAG TPA: hypothetical protein VK574_14480 [Terracidiphilus sp.]|nr:hypothetical protein [Terracidiphilus sp.]
MLSKAVSKSRRAAVLLFVTLILLALSVQARSQSLSSSTDPSVTARTPTSGTLDLTYLRPTEGIKVRNYVYEGFGPYPIAGAAFTAGINQLTDSPPEWNQGIKGFSRRFGSNLGIAIVGTSTRYGLAEAFKEDTLYYRCQCSGAFPRLRHAVISTVIARRGSDGHRVFSFPALVAPYAGSVVAVYGWYPNRFGAKDAFRMGNYSLLAYMGENISLEFFYSGPHSLIARMHLNNLHGSTIKGPNQ